MKYIELTQGMRAIVDDKDFEELSKYKWYYKLYAVRNGWVNGKRTTIRMHRQIIGARANDEIDHKNGYRLDNRRVNLRKVTRSQNMWNRKKQKSTSKYKGVYWNSVTKFWTAQIQVEGKGIYLGIYRNEESAAQAYKEAALKYFGEYARTT